VVGRRTVASAATTLVAVVAVGSVLVGCGGGQPSTFVVDDFESGALTDWQAIGSGSGAGSCTATVRSRCWRTLRCSGSQRCARTDDRTSHARCGLARPSAVLLHRRRRTEGEEHPAQPALHPHDRLQQLPRGPRPRDRRRRRTGSRRDKAASARRALEVEIRLALRRAGRRLPPPGKRGQSAGVRSRSNQSFAYARGSNNSATRYRFNPGTG
jgi:hypothetical protein